MSTTSQKKCKMTRSPQSFAQSWKKMKEKTSSEELHFGHFRSGGTHNLINMINYGMAKFPFRTGYSPKRLKNATDVMIQKSRIIRYGKTTHHCTV